MPLHTVNTFNEIITGIYVPAIHTLKLLRFLTLFRVYLAPQRLFVSRAVRTLEITEFAPNVQIVNFATR